MLVGEGWPCAGLVDHAWGADGLQWSREGEAEGVLGHVCWPFGPCGRGRSHGQVWASFWGLFWACKKAENGSYLGPQSKRR